MNKLLVICGPTATGKTALALHLAKELRGDLLVADSRQVYKGMDVVTGKDLPVNSKYQKSNIKNLGCWETEGGIRIWLADLVGPNQEFSVAQWHKYADKVIKQLNKEKRLPIVVGGTGLYIKSLTENIETLGIPKNKSLRNQLIDKTAEELFGILAQLNSAKAASLNYSEKNNPKRLIRAIEVADWEKINPNCYHVLKHSNKDFLFIGLTAPREVLDANINKRVDERIENGALEEVDKLLANRLSWGGQAMTAIGYAEIRNYFEGKSALNECIDKWKVAERQYARRQLTWFKKDKRVNWFDITKPDWQEEVVKLTQAWYNNNIKN